MFKVVNSKWAQGNLACILKSGMRAAIMGILAKGCVTLCPYCEDIRTLLHNSHTCNVIFCAFIASRKPL